ncbi:SDR family NAD(P)-dependent oxidoreductase [Leifsonia sp. 22587]|uniref:SDR family NAD(P)-dependent oxidoreductase n=1 Tax=Leifsonia sp. 22587 TaxID=3453946 RepID=UPI003F8706CD
MTTTIVITGAAHGIGAATARYFAQQPDSHLHLVDVDGDPLIAVAEEVENAGATVTAHRFGVEDESSWTTLAARIPELDVLVNNAYRARVAPVADQTPQEWREQLDVNLVGQFLAIQALQASLRRRHGSVVNVASVHGHIGIPGYSAYAASKGGVLALTRQLAVELAPEIRVNAVVPGPILTAAWDHSTAEDRERSAHATALLRLGRPDEVAAAIGFLASPDASFITAAELVVDGGWLAKKDSV